MSTNNTLQGRPFSSQQPSNHHVQSHSVSLLLSGFCHQHPNSLVSPLHANQTQLLNSCSLTMPFQTSIKWLSIQPFWSLWSLSGLPYIGGLLVGSNLHKLRLKRITDWYYFRQDRFKLGLHCRSHLRHSDISMGRRQIYMNCSNMSMFSGIPKKRGSLVICPWHNCVWIMIRRCFDQYESCWNLNVSVIQTLYYVIQKELLWSSPCKAHSESIMYLQILNWVSCMLLLILWRSRIRVIRCRTVMEYEM